MKDSNETVYINTWVSVQFKKKIYIGFKNTSVKKLLEFIGICQCDGSVFG